VALARLDWDAQETSWDFEAHPLIASDNLKASLAKSWESYRDSASQMIAKMFKIEMEINELFIQAYELDGELSPIPSEDLITLARPSSDLDCRSFLSYAVGCVMGRYSPHVLDPSPLEGSSSVNQAGSYPGRNVAHRNSWKFQPDPDAIIPVLDGEWFEDDIVARTREFLAVTFPESTVTENLRFIENSLGKDIRKYFCTDFYKDHLQTYKKRPIYWMVQSPKKGFACLIYLHRYTKDTLNQVLNNYFRPYLQKLEARLAQLGLDQLNDSLPTRERTAARKEADKITKVLKECQAWEQDALLPLAQQRIELDLDDGVKVNYLKLQDVLATIPGLAAKDD
jgi:hypothetical protein